LLSQDQNNNVHSVQYKPKENGTIMQYDVLSPVLNLEEVNALAKSPVISGFYYAEVTHLSYLSISGTINSVNLVIANKGFFEHYLKVSDAEAENCYIMPELFSRLESNFQSAPFDDVYLLRKSIELYGNTFDFSEISGNLSPIVTSFYSEFDIDPKETIFFLKDNKNDIIGSEFKIYRIVMKYKTPNKELPYKTQEKFFKQLNNYANSNFLFSEMYIYQMFKKGGDNLNAFVRVFSWAGQVAFLIVVVGISGIFILIIQKRYKQLCICHINGLTKRGAFMQIFIEVLLLVSIPSIIGMILVITFQGKFNSIYYPIEWHPFTTVVFILLPIVITLIVTVVSSSWLRHLNVVKWLKRIE
jgi:hypothetical protein